jgi:hypothetical protein
VLDGCGDGADLERLLKPAGSVVVGDFTPVNQWPRGPDLPAA